MLTHAGRVYSYCKQFCEETGGENPPATRANRSDQGASINSLPDLQSRADIKILRMIQTARLETQIIRALRLDNFMLYYQPQLDMLTNRVIGMEALIRWDSDVGVVLPEQFIPVAEETSLIIQIGEWSINEACRQVAEWSKNGFASPKVAVNVSTRQFSGNLVTVVESALRENDVKPHAIEIEIMETMLAKDPSDAVRIMHDLRRMGVDLSIDDFGTGYSNLSNLKKFPVNTIKIDREFVTGVLEDKSDRVIIQSILDIARHMGMRTLAEGIETEEHRRALLEMGCDGWQGFLFSRPAPPSEMERCMLRTTAH